MGDFIYTIIEMLRNAFVVPIEEAILDFTSMGNIPDISIGFGSVTWFTIPLTDLLLMVICVALVFIILRLLYRFIKWLFRLGKGLTGIR